jgi:putative transposase
MSNELTDNRDFPDRKALPHHVPVWVESGSLFFITICCASRKENQLCNPRTGTAIFASVEHRQNNHDWYARLVLLMPDHLHALVAFPSTAAMTTVTRLWKGFLARQHRVRWPRDFFDHRIRSEESWQEKADYIRQNPVRAGLIKEAADWPYFWEAR